MCYLPIVNCHDCILICGECQIKDTNNIRLCHYLGHVTFYCYNNTCIGLYNENCMYPSEIMK